MLRIMLRLLIFFSFLYFFFILYFFGTTEKNQKKHLKQFFTPLEIKIS